MFGNHIPTQLFSIFFIKNNKEKLSVKHHFKYNVSTSLCYDALNLF
jgi:hypothetical protein